MSDQRKEEDEAVLRARLERLDAALRKQDERREAQRGPSASPTGGAVGKAFSAGVNVFSEFVAAVVVGAFLGWLGDGWLGTKPWLLVAFLGLGTAAGFWNIFRYASRNNARAGESDGPPAGG